MSDEQERADSDPTYAWEATDMGHGQETPEERLFRLHVGLTNNDHALLAGMRGARIGGQLTLPSGVVWSGEDATWYCAQLAAEEVPVVTTFHRAQHRGAEGSSEGRPLRLLHVVPSTTGLTKEHRMPSQDDIEHHRERLQPSAPIVLNTSTASTPEDVRKLTELVKVKEREINGPLLKDATEDELRDELIRRDMQIVALDAEQAEVEATQHELISSTDALLWAAEFCRLFHGQKISHAYSKAVGVPCVDQGTMLAWFANAIETGRTKGRQETCPHQVSITIDETVAVCRQCGLNTTDLPAVPPFEDWPAHALERMTEIAREEAHKIVTERLGGDGR